MAWHSMALNLMVIIVLVALAVSRAVQGHGIAAAIQENRKGPEVVR